MSSNRYAVIMAGGSGTRFWPKSSRKNPKQFLSLVGKRSMIQLTADRLKKILSAQRLSVVCSPEFQAQTKKHLGKIQIITEPEARNTMAAVCLSAWSIAQKNPDAILCVLPADAHIADANGYTKTLESAYVFAEEHSSIVCLGLKPTYPATAYGYIEVGPLLSEGSYKIAHFFEKPTIDKAERYFASGKYLWNAGIFVFKVQTFIEEVQSHAPKFYEAFQQYFKSKPNPTKLKKLYASLPKEPVDIALMEKTNKGAVCVGDFGWNDIGSWPALAEVLPQNSEAGLVMAPGGHMAVNSSGIVAQLESKKFLGLVGVKDLVIVETKDAFLICAKDKAQEIKTLVDMMSQSKFKKLT